MFPVPHGEPTPGKVLSGVVEEAGPTLTRAPWE